MKRVCKLIMAFAAATVVIWQSASCEKYILPGITATPDTLRFTSAAGSQASNVSSNVKCKVSISTTEEGEEIKWMSCDGMEYAGKGDAVFNITVNENVSGTQRHGAVVITSEAFEKKIIVIQDKQI